MLPASTLSPPNRLTPSRRPAESRPFRDDPPAFLWAMGSLFLLCGRGCVGTRRRASRGQDLLDPDAGMVLALAVAGLGVLAAALLEDEDLVAARLVDDLAGDAGAVDQRRADGHTGLAAGHENLLEG